MKLRSLIVSSLLGLSLAACNAGSTLPASSTTAQTSVSQQLSGVQSGATQTLTAVNGVTPSVTLPTLSTPFSGTVNSSTVQPSNVATFDVKGPVVQGRSAQSTVAGATPVLFVAVTPSTTTTATGTVSLSATLSSVSSTSAYYLAFFDGTSWNSTYTTAGTVSGNTVTFANIALPSSGLTLTAGTTYAVALYTLAGVEGTVAQGQQISGTLDGNTASITLPSGVTGATYGTYSAFGSASSLPSSLQLPSSGTFLGAVSVVPQAGFVTSGQLSIPYTITAGSGASSETIALYYVTSNAAPVSVGSVTTSPTGAVQGSFTVPSGTSVTAGTSYTFAAYK